ncbi:DUF3459 domain-containing protein [Methylobacterium sp. WL64]|uniref:alpha-amylase family glycosyl hydrolase n=1 Tax=Methylobacterium sp. WL64 TaxID=2603894 RepID=UPI0011CCA3E5|nr:alpha-amylase family glycosyl hydrolase [Methylobacterium sp. WL64]TXM99100.1 DUF3459 domain-containing protein [Methylobacterium sp. WL64]
MSYSIAESHDVDRRAAEPLRPWWQDAVVYQVYIRSFQDSDGDGVGDLDGVIAHLDHLVWLGVDAVWLSPFHPSPMLDGGYDVSAFLDVDPRFGTLQTFDRLIAEAHGRRLKVILDYVPNHTSDRHSWFQDSRASTDNPKRDWYVWRDGRDEGPPNDWRSMLGQPAWTRDAATGQFYYHAFLPQQPDLNWRNPEVREAMHAVLRFWLDRGVDGFRVDAVAHLVEDDLLRDDVPGDLAGEGLPVQAGMRHAFTSDRPETHVCVAEWRRLTDGYEGRVLIGEAHLPTERVMRYYGLDAPAFHLPFNFVLLSTAWDARALAAAVDQYHNLLPPGAWPNWVLGNHDEQRVASRIGPAQARVAAMLVLTVGGTPFIYNGDELGLEDAQARAEAVRHPDVSRDRDPQRSPMPWDAGRHAGFTTGEPWLPLGSNNAARNVAAQVRDPASMLDLYRQLIALRREEPALAHGAYEPLAGSNMVLAYIRALGGVKFAVALNIDGKAATMLLPGTGSILISTYLDRAAEVCAMTLALRPNEGIVLRLL